MDDFGAKYRESTATVQSNLSYTSTKTLPGKCSYTVYLLDGQPVQIQVDKKARGQVLFHECCLSLSPPIDEKDYFSLSYDVMEHTNMRRTWLDFTKPIAKQMINAPNRALAMNVKFYPPDPTNLMEYTRYLFYLQLRDDVSKGKMPCAFVTQSLLASYVCQADMGDFVEGQDFSFLEEFPFGPDENSPDFIDKVVELWRGHFGLTASEAEMNYIENAKKLPMYGTDLHPAVDSENIYIDIGINYSGVLVFRDKVRINRIVWPKILKISYKRDYFYIRVRPAEQDKFEKTVGFKMEGHKAAKRVWKICVEHHAFFRLVRPDPRSKKLTLGSKPNLTFQTEYQVKKSATIRSDYQTFDRYNTLGSTGSLNRSQNRRALSMEDILRTPTTPGGQDYVVQPAFEAPAKVRDSPGVEEMSANGYRHHGGPQFERHSPELDTEEMDLREKRLPINFARPPPPRVEKQVEIEPPPRVEQPLESLPPSRFGGNFEEEPTRFGRRHELEADPHFGNKFEVEAEPPRPPSPLRMQEKPEEMAGEMHVPDESPTVDVHVPDLEPVSVDTGKRKGFPFMRSKSKERPEKEKKEKKEKTKKDKKGKNRQSMSPERPPLDVIATPEDEEISFEPMARSQHKSSFERLQDQGNLRSSFEELHNIGMKTSLDADFLPPRGDHFKPGFNGYQDDSDEDKPPEPPRPSMNFTPLAYQLQQPQISGNAGIPSKPTGVYDRTNISARVDMAPENIPPPTKANFLANHEPISFAPKVAAKEPDFRSDPNTAFEVTLPSDVQQPRGRELTRPVFARNVDNNPPSDRFTPPPATVGASMEDPHRRPMFADARSKFFGNEPKSEAQKTPPPVPKKPPTVAPKPRKFDDNSWISQRKPHEPNSDVIPDRDLMSELNSRIQSRPNVRSPIESSEDEMANPSAVHSRQGTLELKSADMRVQPIVPQKPGYKFLGPRSNVPSDGDPNYKFDRRVFSQTTREERSVPASELPSEFQMSAGFAGSGTVQSQTVTTTTTVRGSATRNYVEHERIIAGGPQPQFYQPITREA